MRNKRKGTERIDCWEEHRGKKTANPHTTHTHTRRTHTHTLSLTCPKPKRTHTHTRRKTKLYVYQATAAQLKTVLKESVCFVSQLLLFRRSSIKSETVGGDFYLHNNEVKINQFLIITSQSQSINKIQNKS